MPQTLVAFSFSIPTLFFYYIVSAYASCSRNFKLGHVPHLPLQTPPFFPASEFCCSDTSPFSVDTVVICRTHLFPVLFKNHPRFVLAVIPQLCGKSTSLRLSGNSTVRIHPDPLTESPRSSPRGPVVCTPKHGPAALA